MPLICLKSNLNWKMLRRLRIHLTIFFNVTNEIKLKLILSSFFTELLSFHLKLAHPLVLDSGTKYNRTEFRIFTIVNYISKANQFICAQWAQYIVCTVGSLS